MAKPKGIGNRIAPARFLLFIGLLAVGWGVSIAALGTERGLLVGFDLAALTFLGSSVPWFKLGTVELRLVAAANDANRWVLLVVSFLLMLVILAAITAQLSTPSGLPWTHKLLIAASLVIVWTFGNAIYALHYAHLYYSRADGGRDSAGLAFPATKEPDFADFAYFAFTIGVALQTSDVAVTSPHIRRIVTVHCIVAFFFNLGVLALSINVLGTV
jgi:uncharacterized membrane protein